MTITQPIAAFWRFVAGIAILAGLCSCGGGTTGTDSGGRNIRIMGVVAGPDGAPVADAQVVVLESGDDAVSSESGEFLLNTRTDATILNLEVAQGGARGTVTLTDLPSQDSLLALNLNFDRTSQRVTLISITITPLGQSPTSIQGGEDRLGESDGSSEDQATQSTPSNSIFSGTVSFSDGDAVNSARIIVKDTNRWDTTSRLGRFWIESPIVGGDVVLVIEYGGLRDRVVLPNIPREAVHVDVQLQLNFEEPASANPLPSERAMAGGRNDLPRIKTRVVRVKVERR